MGISVRTVFAAGALLALSLLAGCLVFVRKVEVREVRPDAATVKVETPLKAHLTDGGVVVFERGARFNDSLVTGNAVAYNLALESHTVTSVPLDSVVAFETFSTQIDGSRTLKASAIGIGIPLAVIGVICAVDPKACFGSCPTVYSHGSSGTVLEAESFSNSISRLLEMRDVDRLTLRSGSGGQVELEVRNEALETHYINHLELLSVDHEVGEFAVPMRSGNALVVGDLRSAVSAADRAGNNVTGVISALDGEAYHTAAAVLEDASEDDLFDHIELTFASQERDSVALVFTARNSLLNTVLFYDFMLSGAGPKSIEWIGSGMESIGTALTVGTLYMERMGLRVSVWNGVRYEDVARIGNTGPIAWDDMGIVMPVLSSDVRIRLSFLADSWRIDRVAIASDFREVPVEVYRPTAVVVDGVDDPESLRRVGDADDFYLITMPTDRFDIRFDLPPMETGREQTYFLAAQGYYTEWVRRDWIREQRGDGFESSDATLLAAIRRWKDVKGVFEAEFVNTRLPVR